MKETNVVRNMRTHQNVPDKQIAHFDRQQQYWRQTKNREIMQQKKLPCRKRVGSISLLMCLLTISNVQLICNNSQMFFCSTVTSASAATCSASCCGTAQTSTNLTPAANIIRAGPSLHELFHLNCTRQRIIHSPMWITFSGNGLGPQHLMKGPFMTWDQLNTVMPCYLREH